MRWIASALVLFAGLATPAAAQAAAPTGVSGFALESRVDLAWQPAAGAASYAVYRGTAKNTITTRVSPPGGVLTTSYTDTTAVNGTTYYYAVRAVIGGIESVDSSPLQATPASRTCSAGSPVVLENCLPGNPNWRVLNPGNAGAGGIEGFATQQSINKGESVGLKVRSSGPYDIQVFRMGYYGGAGARLVSSLRDLPASTQPACATDGNTGLVDCANWAQSSALSTTAGWTSGMYLLRIVRTDNNADYHILVTVRDDGRRSDILFGAAFTTYQAYNQYGGRSLYDFNSIGSDTVAGTPRAVKVSFDRPFEQPRTRQRDWYVEVDQPYVSWLEQEGYDVNYASDADLERFPAIARNTGAYFSPAHDEYWSGGMRTALEQARDAGTHLFFGGANEVYWKIRFENNGRTQVCYKSTQSGGPDPSGIPTGTWRDPAGANKPENGLTGAMYVGDKDFGYFPLKISAAEGTDRVYRYTGLETQTPGTSTLIGANLVGWEWDARVNNGAEPAGTKTLASSPVTGNLIQGDGKFQTPGSTTVNAVKYTAPSGALVVTTGTNHWWRGLGRNIFGDGEPDQRIQQATTNMLADMNATPRTPPAGIVLDGTSAGVPVPVNTVATPVGTDSVRITWDPVAGASGYNVYRALAPRQDGLPLGTVASPGPVAATTFTDTGLEPATRYYYVVTAVVAGNQSRASAETSAQTPAAAGASTRINAGGAAYTTATGATYAADGAFTGGTIYSTTQAITGSPDAALYQNERWGQFSYALPVANGTYDVRLHFVELYYGTAATGGAGKRVFGMDIVDTTANPDLANIDPFAQAGARTPLVRTIPGVTITDGTLNLRSVYGAADDPEIAAIEVIPSAPAGPPTVTATTPPNASANLATSAAPTATFSRAMDASTITGSTFTLTRADGAAVPATVAYNATTRVATLTPSAPLSTSSTYTARLTTGVKAADGPALSAAVTWTFSTLGPAPAVTQTTPAGGATGVSVGVRPTATFTRDLDPSTVTSTSFTLTRADGAGVAAAVAYDAPTRTATVTPALALDGSTGYTAALETTIKAADGASLTTRVTWSFTTGAAPPGPPTVSGRTPATGATGVPIAVRPTATFSGTMDAATISASSFTLRRPDGTTVPAVVGYDDTSRTATLTPNADLAYSTAYTARLESSITAADGLGLASAPVTWTFTTGAAPDTTPPTVSITAPASGATVSGAVPVAVTAADAGGVAGVQVRVDGTDVGAEDTAAPYTATWDTRAVPGGAHTLTAVARDAVGNATTSAGVSVTVDNSTPPPVAGLVAAYGFEETTGTTALDSSANGLNGTLNGPTRVTTGRFGSALSFDGVNDVVNVADANALDLTNGMTLEAWVNPAAITGWRTVLMKEKAADLVYALYSNSDLNRPTAHVQVGGDRSAAGTAQVALNTWTHLAATYDGTTVRLYVGGVQVGTRAITGVMAASTQPLRIGGNTIWTSEWFSGRLDEIRVYNRALSAAEIQTDLSRAVKP